MIVEGAVEEVAETAFEMIAEMIVNLMMIVKDRFLQSVL